MTPERDIAERLLTGEPCLEANGRPCRSMDAQSGCACAEAAAEITRLRTALADAEAKLVKAREALTKAADHIEGVTGSNERPGSDSAEIVDEVRATIKSLTDT